MSGSRLAERDVDVSLRAGEVTVQRQAIRGEVVARNDAAYDQARRVWNGMIDRRPSAVVSSAPAPMMLFKRSSLRARDPC